jgi:hypothetical protein
MRGNTAKKFIKKFSKEMYGNGEIRFLHSVAENE